MNDQPKLNSEGVMKAVAVAMMNAGKLDKEQRGDLIMAALNAFKTSLIDDLTHGIGVEKLPPEVICARLVDLGLAMEEIRHQSISRFANMCELLKPECDIQIQFNNAPNPASDTHAVVMQNNGSIN